MWSNRWGIGWDYMMEYGTLYCEGSFNGTTYQPSEILRYIDLQYYGGIPY